MPIYEYKCTSCGHKKEVLQKLSDAPLKQCPACGKATLSKLISAAGFQLKGSGWYATDFKGGSKSGNSEKGKDDGKPKDENKPKDESKVGADDKAKVESKASDDSKGKSESKSKEGAKSDPPASSAGASPAGQ